MALTGCVGAAGWPIYDPAYSTNPDYVQSPPSSVVVDGYGRDAGLGSAQATVRLECLVTDKGRAEACRVLKRDLDDGRADGAATAIVKSLQLKPAMYAGVPMDGARVRWTVRFNQPDVPSIEIEPVRAPRDGRFAYAGVVRDGKAALYVRGPETVQADGSVEIWLYEFPMNSRPGGLVGYRASFRRYDCVRRLRDDPTVEVLSEVNQVKALARGSNRTIRVSAVGAEAAAFRIACHSGPEVFNLSGLAAVRNDVQRKRR